MKHRIKLPEIPSLSPPDWLDTYEDIPACATCEGDGCAACLGTGLTGEDCDFAGLAGHLAEMEVRGGATEQDAALRLDA